MNYSRPLNTMLRVSSTLLFCFYCPFAGWSSESPLLLFTPLPQSYSCHSIFNLIFHFWWVFMILGLFNRFRYPCNAYYTQMKISFTIFWHSADAFNHGSWSIQLDFFSHFVQVFPEIITKYLRFMAQCTRLVINTRILRFSEDYRAAYQFVFLTLNEISSPGRNSREWAFQITRINAFAFA